MRAYPFSDWLCEDLGTGVVSDWSPCSADVSLLVGSPFDNTSGVRGNIWAALKHRGLVSMEQHRNARAREKGDPPENSLTSDIVRQDSHITTEELIILSWHVTSFMKPLPECCLMAHGSWLMAH
ncbi:hypothetical protein PR048_018842 [Dryococelus australis]|uniref:Uncharacterized protein n=1 Tax=Dryococelus australis TaxID=614101 RepID=A0ABQ9H1T3_9NEOP|nr:hypothetical protein PR048_018842 [Dryococelus australis]